MIALTIISILSFILIILSLVSASKEFQNFKPEFEKLLDDENKPIAILTEKVINDSLSFFSVYHIMFGSKIKNDRDIEIKINDKEKKAIEFLAKAYLQINFKAYWYNYAIIFIIVSIINIFKNINISIFNLEEKIFNAEKINLLGVK